MTDQETLDNIVCEILNENLPRIEAAFSHRKYPMWIRSGTGKLHRNFKRLVTSPILLWGTL